MSERAVPTRLSRRALALGLASVAGTALTRRTAWAEQVAPTPVVTGDCSVEPGVQLLIDWRLGKPVMTIEQLLPPLDWVPYTHPTLPLIFRYPPDWTPQALWADTFTPTGAPIWRDQPPMLPQLSLARIVSPTEDAAFEFAVGNIQGPPLTPGQAAVVAKQGILGERPRLTSICTYEDLNPLMPSWFHTDYAGKAILVSSGVAIAQPSIFLPATTVTYQNLLGPQEQFEDLMRTIFLPILVQFLGGGGDRDDDDDDDDDNDDQR